MKLQPNETKPSGPYVIDRTNVKVGEYVTICERVCRDFEDGDRVKVIGFSLEGEYDLDEPTIHGGRYFPPGIYKEVTYQVALYARTTGKLIQLVSIYPSETSEYKWNGHFTTAVPTRILKPAIKALRDAGMENAARVLEGQRAEYASTVRRERRQELKRRHERDRREALKTLARMSQQKRVTVNASNGKMFCDVIEQSDADWVVFEQSGRFKWENIANLELKPQEVSNVS